jgi:hypothetical protein
MANTKISALSDGTPAQVGDLIPIDRMGSNFSVTAADVSALNIPTIASPGFFWANQVWFKDSTDNGSPSLPGANVVQFAVFTLPFNITVAKIVAQVTTAGGAGSTANFGFYDANKNKILDSGAIDTSTDGFKNITLGVPVYLPAGNYYYAYSGNEITPTAKFPSYGGSTPLYDQMMNNNTPRWGQASNPTVSGVLPATLGTLSNASIGVTTHPYAILFEA